MNNFFGFLNIILKKEIKIKKNFSEFFFSNLNLGFGNLIGNFIRRTLFMCTEGYSVEKIFFYKNKEFCYIPGINKDITEIIFKIKKIIFKLNKINKTKINVKIIGPKILYAKDFETKHCKVINKKKKILEISKGGKIEFYIKVGKGVGYKKINKNYNEKDEIIIDSYYCPIKKVYFDVEEKKNYENLKLGIKTNNSISPFKAIKNSFLIAKNFFNLCFDKKNIKKNSFIFKKIKKNYSKEIFEMSKNKNFLFYGDIIKNLHKFKKNEIENIKRIFFNMGICI